MENKLSYKINISEKTAVGFCLPRLSFCQNTEPSLNYEGHITNCALRIAHYSVRSVCSSEPSPDWFFVDLPILSQFSKSKKERL